jgi:hypothetical protein
MRMRLDEISANVATKARGVVPMDRAGWQGTDKLKVPKNRAIIEVGCQAWNKRINQPKMIISIGIRAWAHAGQ